jgi:hypothetical protein
LRELKGKLIMALSSPGADLQASAIKERLDRLHRELAQLRRRANRATALTAIVGLAALVLIGGYFYYGYTQVRQLTQAEKLVVLGQTMLEDNLPGIRKSLEEEVSRSAPAWAEELSKQAQTSMPTGRQKLEDYIIGQVDSSVNEAALLTDNHFRTFLRTNRPLLEQKFKELGSSPKLAERSLAEVEIPLEDELREDMQVQARELLDALFVSNLRLEELKRGKKLSPEENLERRVLMLARRLQLEQLKSQAGDGEAAETGTENAASTRRAKAPSIAARKPTQAQGQQKKAGQ